MTRKALLAAVALVLTAIIAPAGIADSPPPIVSSPGIPLPWPQCSANTDAGTANGNPPKVLPGDVFPCVSGYPSDEGWPTPSGSIDSIAKTADTNVSGPGAVPAAIFTFKATVSQAPGSVIGHLGPDCADNGTLWWDIYHPDGRDCHAVNPAGTQSAEFVVGDDRLWLPYFPAFYSIPAKYRCSDLWTRVFSESYLLTKTTPNMVAASAAKIPQLITGVAGHQKKPTSQAQRMCLTVSPASTPLKNRINGLNVPPLYILAERTYTVPARAPTVEPLVFGEITHAARARLAKLKSWRNGTGRRLKITERQRTQAKVRATWHTRGKNQKRYAVTVKVRKTRTGTTAGLGHTTRKGT
jgi:hypothetical protein